MNNRDFRILTKVSEEIKIVETMLEGIDEQEFLSDEKIKRAVSMTLINIGELIKNITPELKKRNDHIQWKEISGLRDVAAHKYLSLKMEDIYLTAITDVKTLSAEIDKLLQAGDDSQK